MLVKDIRTINKNIYLEGLSGYRFYTENDGMNCSFPQNKMNKNFYCRFKLY